MYVCIHFTHTHTRSFCIEPSLTSHVCMTAFPIPPPRQPSDNNRDPKSKYTATNGSTPTAPDTSALLGNYKNLQVHAHANCICPTRKPLSDSESESRCLIRQLTQNVTQVKGSQGARASVPGNSLHDVIAYNIVDNMPAATAPAVGNTAIQGIKF